MNVIGKCARKKGKRKPKISIGSHKRNSWSIFVVVVVAFLTTHTLICLGYIDFLRDACTGKCTSRCNSMNGTCSTSQLHYYSDESTFCRWSGNFHLTHMLDHRAVLRNTSPCAWRWITWFKTLDCMYASTENQESRMNFFRDYTKSWYIF